MKRPYGIYLAVTLVLIGFGNRTILNAQISNLDAFIAAEMSEKHIPGLSACVVKKGQIVWQGAYGTANFDTGAAVSTQTLFTIASLSKLVVATAVLQMHETGQIDLDANVNNYLPFELTNPNFTNEAITARMLLQHKSSLRDPESVLFDLLAEGDSDIALDAYLEDVLTEGGAFYSSSFFSNTLMPGEGNYFYSNMGFSVLALMVETVMDIDFRAYCQTHIFAPLCMESTTFYLSETTNQLAMPYAYNAGTYVPYGYYGLPAYPSALLKTNIHDLSKFLIAYTNRGYMDVSQILSPESVDMLTPYSLQEENLGWWNGLTWTYTFHFPDDEVWYHGGYMPGVRARLNYYPQDSTGIIILTNGEGQYGEIEEELLSLMDEYEYGSPEVLTCGYLTNNEELMVEEVKFYSVAIPEQKQMAFNYEFPNSQTYHLHIYDINGRKIQTQKLQGAGQHILPTKNLAKGMYVYQVLLGDVLVSKGKMLLVE